MDIQEFLLARIAEDEAVARGAIDQTGWWSSPDGRWELVEVPYEGEWPRSPDAESVMWSDSKWAVHASRHDPARILAECAAKRVIIEAQHWEPEERPADAELHARAAHPAYEYETTEGPRKQWDNPEEPPEGEGWEPNTAKGYRDGWARLEYTEESYWRRLKPEGERREWKPYIPRELRALAAVYADHPDYQEVWKP